VADSCQFGGVTKRNHNCTTPAEDDGLPVQCVGAWSKDKHDYLSRYLAASANPRKKYLPPEGTGGAAFIDLFAGPGRARVQTTGELVDGSPLIALKQPVPFTKVVLCESDEENITALTKRTAAYPQAKIIPGDCNKNMDKVVKEVPPYGLNVAWIDPFRLADLWFDTIGRLASFKRMDLIVFFPVGEIRRFTDAKRKTYGPLLTRALGTDEWQKKVPSGSDAPQLIPVFRQQLDKRFGYGPENGYTAPIKNDQGAVLYHLVFASKHAKGEEIWDRVTKRSPAGQKRLL
jgi:three-Cys-motif partner protein